MKTKALIAGCVGTVLWMVVAGAVLSWLAEDPVRAVVAVISIVAVVVAAIVVVARRRPKYFVAVDFAATTDKGVVAVVHMNGKKRRILVPSIHSTGVHSTRTGLEYGLDLARAAKASRERREK